MTTTILKKELTKAIASINDKSLLEALFTIVNRADVSEYEIPDEDWHIVEERKQDYKSGKIKGVNRAQAHQRIMKRIG